MNGPDDERIVPDDTEGQGLRRQVTTQADDTEGHGRLQRGWKRPDDERSPRIRP